MKIRPSGEESNLGPVPPRVAVVADVQGLMQVADPVDDEPQRHAPLLEGPVRVPEDVHELGQLADHVAAAPIAKPFVVARLIDRHVDVVPGRAAGNPASVLIGPSRGVGQTLPVFEQRLDGLSRLRVQVPFGDPGGEAVPEASPGPHRRGGLQRGQQGQGHHEPGSALRSLR
jgi:hypothetical protein